MEQRLEKQMEKPRLAFIDNLRWLVIVMVVVIHICATYSGLGGWYYHEEAQLDVPSLAVFFAYESFSQAFFMGFLFLLAGYFVPAAYDRKGFGRFALERLLRLGVPTVVFVFILHPLTEFIKKLFLRPPLRAADIAAFFKWFIGNRIFLRETGPLWFALALLVFSLVYGLVRRAAEAVGVRRAGERSASRPVSHGLVVALIALMAAASFLVRLVQSFGTSWYNLQLCFFSQYVILFLVGLWAARTNFLASMSYRFGMLWFRLALAAGIPAWAVLLTLGGAFSGNEQALLGGLHWQAAGYALWEAFFCVGVCLGLIVLYRERVNVRGRLTGFLAANNFGVYVFHTPILVAVSLALRPLAYHPLAKTLLVAVLVLPACFLFAALVRRVPALKRLFS
jgi:glucan biosynthesis protein C